MLYALPTQCVINIRRSSAEKGSVFPYQRSDSHHSLATVHVLALWVLQQFPKTSIYRLPQVCCVWHLIPDQPTNGRYSIFKAICDLCWKVVTKQNKLIISFCCWLQGFVYPIILNVDIDVIMSSFFLIIRNSQAFPSEDYACKKLKREFIFKIRNIGVRLKKLTLNLCWKHYCNERYCLFVYERPLTQNLLSKM